MTNMEDMDEFNLNKWAKENKLSDATTNALLKEHFTDEEELITLDQIQMMKIGGKYDLPLPELFTLMQAINKLKENSFGAVNKLKALKRKSNEPVEDVVTDIKKQRFQPADNVKEIPKPVFTLQAVNCRDTVEQTIGEVKTHVEDCKTKMTNVVIVNKQLDKCADTTGKYLAAVG